MLASLATLRNIANPLLTLCILTLKLYIGLKQYEVATIQDLSDLVEERHECGAGRLALLIGRERVESMRDDRTQKTENTEFEALGRHRQKRNRAEVVNGGIILLRNSRNGGVLEESRDLAGEKRRVHDVANRDQLRYERHICRVCSECRQHRYQRLQQN